MEKNKEVVKKPYTNAYERQKVGNSKSNLIKSNSHIPPRAEDTKNRLSNLSRSRNNPSISKKSAVYGNEVKHLYKHNCDECVIKKNPNLIVNPVTVDRNTSERKLEHCHNLNGNLFNVRPNLCNLTCSVPEISHLNRVLNFPTARHNELTFNKCTKQKQRTVYQEHRGYNYKNPNSSNAFPSSKFSSTASCNARCHCSKNSSWNASNVEPYFNISTTESVSESIIASEEYNLKCSANSIVKDCENLTDLPILVHSNFSKESWEVKYSLNSKLRINSKQRKWNSKSWGQVAIQPDRTLADSRAFDKTDKMLFPALPSNSYSQVKLNSSHTNSMPPSEHSSAENSDLESVNSFPDGNVNCTASSFLTSVSSTIPQASYADVIRMSSAGVQSLLATDFEKTSEQNLSLNPVISSLPEKLQKDENNQPGSSDWVISRLSQLDQSSSDVVHNVSVVQASQNEQNFGASRPIVVSLEKPSFYNSSLQSNKSVLSTYTPHTNITSEAKVMEDENLINDCLCGLEKISQEKVNLLSESLETACLSDIVSDVNIPGTSLKTDSVYSSPSSIDSFSDAFKSAESSILNTCNYSKIKDPPVVIMNSSSSPQSMSEISFGIGYDEMMKLCSDSCDTPIKSVSSFSLQDADDCCFSEENTKLPETTVEPPKTPEATSVELLVTAEKFITIRDKKFYFKDVDVESRYNHQQVAEYFASGLYP